MVAQFAQQLCENGLFLGQDCRLDNTKDKLIQGELVVTGSRLGFFLIFVGGLLGGIQFVVGLLGLFGASLISILGAVVVVGYLGLLVDPVFNKLDEEGRKEDD